MQVGEHRRQRVGAVEVGAAIRADDLHAGVLAETQEMPQQQQRGFGRPVQVVEDQDDGRARRGHCQQRDDGVEKCVAFGVRVGAGRRGQIGEDIGQPGNQREQCFHAAQPPKPACTEARHQRTQSFRERLVRRTEVLVASAVNHQGALVVGLSRPFAGQTRLADTRFAGDQHRVRAAGERGLPRGRQSLELVPAPDERPGAGEHRGQARALQRRVG